MVCREAERLCWPTPVQGRPVALMAPAWRRVEIYRLTDDGEQILGPIDYPVEALRLSLTDFTRTVVGPRVAQWQRAGLLPERSQWR
jgi:hypothetical protein